MMHTTRDAADSLLVRAHTIRVLAHGSIAATEQEMLHLDECIDRFEASVLLNAPESVVAEWRRRLDAQIACVEGRVPSRGSSSTTTVGTSVTRGLAVPR